jgi:archaeal type IV pilus assembly protein PilA
MQSLSNILINPKGGIEREMKTLRKIRKNAKALSPVVASIILIAVTVAVSIAVAAWMGALTVGFMGSSSININDVTFETGNAYATLSVKNVGTNTVTIASIKVNNAAATVNGTSTLSYEAGATGDIGIALSWTAGNPYKIDLYDGSGQVVGSFQATAS